MYFDFVAVDGLPKLSWCAQIKRGSDSVVVQHGNQVEVFPEFFAEGAWNGDFSADGFISATILCGSGATLEPDQIRFSSSTDTLAPIFSILKNDVLYVSNSPMFVLSAAGEKPDPVYPFYAYDMVSFLRQGLYCKAGKLKTASGVSLQVHFATIMFVTKALSVSFEDHPSDEEPEDFRHYKQMLLQGVTQVLANGCSLSRRQRYKPLAFVSRGYDCNATAALAQAAGCREAATLFDSRQKNPNQDSGAEVARYLGMSCVEKDRWDYFDSVDPVESEFAFLTISANPSVSSFEDYLAGRILITGNFGDGIWSKIKVKQIDQLARPWLRQLSGLSQLEFRLRVGYLLFGPAYIGARHNKAIESITHSTEMRAWNIGGDYDRPIPRRIIEEAGVPRQAFGLKQFGSSQVQLSSVGNFSSRSLAAYKEFIRMSHGAAPMVECLYWYLYSRIEYFSWRACKRFQKNSLCPLPCPRWMPIVLKGNRTNVPWKFMFMFQWVFDSLKSRYHPPERIS